MKHLIFQSRFLILLLGFLTIGISYAWGETVTYSPSSTTAVSKSGTAPQGSSASFSATYNNKNQITANNSQTLTLSGYDGCTITGVSLNMKKSSNGSSASVDVKVNGKSINSTTSVTLTTTATDYTIELTSTQVEKDKDIVFTITAAKSSAYVYSYTITYEEGAAKTALAQVTNLSAGTLTATSATITWTGIADSDLDGYKVEYKKNSESTWTVAEAKTSSTSCTLSGLTPSTTYNYRVTSLAKSTSSTKKDSDPKAGTNFTTDAPASREIKWYANNQQVYAKTQQEGAALTIPSDPDATTYCYGKTFVGWTASQNYSDASTAPGDLFTSTDSKTVGSTTAYYAVFADAEGGDEFYIYYTYSNVKYYVGDYDSNKKVLNGYTDIASASTFTIEETNYILANGTTYVSHTQSGEQYVYYSSTKPSSGLTITKNTGTLQLRSKAQTSRYFGFDNSNKVFKFYASSQTVSWEPAVSYSNYTTTCAPVYEATVTSGIANGSVVISKTDNISTGVASLQGLKEGDKVYIFPTANTGYKLDAVTVNGTPITDTEGKYIYTTGEAGITVSATFSCATPTFKTDLTEETIEKIQNLDAPTLSVEKNESWATYQWQSSANKSAWENIASATNASYTPSVATVGTTYYRCLLKNGVSPCETSTPSKVVTLNVVAPSKCEIPTFSLEAKTYTGAQSVELACVTEGAKIYYTTDGTEPSTSSTEYTGAINVFKTMTIRAIAAKEGIESSEEGTATYTIQYTVTFNMQSYGSQVADQKVGYEGSVSEPATTSITGWTFGGWFKEGACTNQWDFATDKVTGTTTLYAKWTMTKFDVKFYNNGDLVQTYNIQEGLAVGTLPVLTSTDAKDARSKTFVGWTTDKLTNWQEQAPTPVTSTKVVEGELTLNAVWAKEVGAQATWTKIASKDINESGIYALITLNGNAFTGSISSGRGAYTTNTFAFTNNIATSAPDGTCELEITAYELQNGRFVFDIYNDTYGYLYIKNAAEGNLAWTESTPSDVDFWTYEDEDNNFEYWHNPDEDYYYASLRVNSGTFRTYGYAETAGNAIAFAKKMGGTSLTDYITHSSASPLESITLNTDNVKIKYFVGETFTSANLSATAKLEDGIEFPVEHDALTIEGPDNLSTAGEKTVTVKYTFNNQEQQAEYKVNAYSVTVNMVYTDRVDDEPVTGNTYSWTPTTGALTFSTQDHYQFNGISDVVGATPTGSDLSYTLSNPTANVTLTATWQRLFTLQYNSKGGGTVSSVTDVTSGTPVETMPSPKFTGYDLVGWFDNEGYTGDAVTFPYAITKDETLFAKWEVKTTEITLSQTDATTKGTEKVIATWGQAMPEATMPQREHYQFAGYKLNSTLYYNANGSSAKDWDKEDEKATLIAQWEINKHNIILPAVLAGGTLGVSTGTSNVSYDATVTITPYPNAHYTLTALTWNGNDILSSKSFKMPDEDVTIAATFTEDTKRTISWSVGGQIASTTADVYDGTAFSALNPPTVGDNAAGDCADKFMGWAIAPINTQGGIDKDAVQWADEATTSESQNTFYAVFAKASGSGLEPVFTETFNNCNGSGGNDGSWSGSIASASFSTDNTGWSSSYSYGGNECARFGKSGQVGSATTPSITMNGNGVIYLRAGSWGTDGSVLSLSATSGTLGQISIELTNSEFKDYEISISNVTNSTQITFSSTSGKRFFIDNVQVKASNTTYSNYITQCCTTPEHPLEITNTDLTVKTGKTLQLNTTDGNGAIKVWASKNGAVATVSDNGIVTPVSTGKAIITVSQEATNGFCAQYDEVEIEVIAANEFGISFTAAEGGSTVAKVNDTPTNKATTGTTVTITATPADDYNFTGWEVNAGGVILEDASALTTTFIMGEADVEITPSFTLKQFTITLDAGNGTVDDESTIVLENQDIHSKIALPNAVACNSDEWEFKGWATSSVTETAIEPTFVSADEYEVTEDATLYAVYGQTTTVDGDYKYKIYAKLSDTDKRYLKGAPYASGQKVNTIAVGTETEAQIYTLITIDASANKYALKYTNNSTDEYLCIVKETKNNSTSYYLQSKTSLDGNAAYWTMLDGAKGGKIFTNAQHTNHGIIYRGDTYNCVRAYQTSNVSADGTQYYDLQLQLVGREQTEGGVWNSNPSCKHHYQVTYDGNGTTTTCTSEKWEEGEITLCADEPSLAGYTFAGWNDGTTTYAAGVSYNLTAPVTFTAVWNPIKVTAITLNVTEPQTLNWKSDLASAPTFQLSVESTTPAAVADNSVTWSVSEGTAVSVSATGLVTAVEAGTATITATANDGSGVTASCTFTVTKTYKLTIIDPEVITIKVNNSQTKNRYFEVNTPITLTKSVSKGYNFGEWVVKQGEESITVTDDKFTMPAAEVTVTATFTTKKDYYVDDMNNNAQIVMEGKYTVPSLPDVVTPSSTNSCEQTHLYFVGWIEGEIDEGQPDVPTGLITAGEEKTAGEKTYHAVWAEDSNNNQ